MRSPAARERIDDRALSSRTPAEGSRGALAALTLLVIVIAMPVALWALGRSLRLTDLSSLSKLGAALTQPDDGSLLLAALLLIAWLGWAVFSISVVVEVAALIRGIPTPPLPLLRVPQHGAAALVASAALLLTQTGATTEVPVARPVAMVVALDPIAHLAPSGPSPRGISGQGSGFARSSI